MGWSAKGAAKTETLSSSSIVVGEGCSEVFPSAKLNSDLLHYSASIYFYFYQPQPQSAPTNASVSISWLTITSGNAFAVTQKCAGPGQGQGVSCRGHQESFQKLAQCFKKSFGTHSPFTYHNPKPLPSHKRRFFDQEITIKSHNLKKESFQERRMWRESVCPFYLFTS